MKKLKFVLLIIIILLSSNIFGQNQNNIFEGLGIEIGIGHNSLNWIKSMGFLTLGDGQIKRKNLYLTENIRGNYRILIRDRVYAHLFIGYNKFGGKSDNDSYTFKTYEYGLLAQYKYYKFAYGLGIKVNQILSSIYNYSPYFNDEDRINLFTDYSGNIGLRVSYIYKFINISAEVWLGVSNLSADEGKIYENHYRILFGFYYI